MPDLVKPCVMQNKTRRALFYTAIVVLPAFVALWAIALWAPAAVTAAVRIYAVALLFVAVYWGLRLAAFVVDRVTGFANRHWPKDA